MNLGADGDGMLCAELEAHGRDGRMAAAAPALDRLREELDAVGPVLRDVADELVSHG